MTVLGEKKSIISDDALREGIAHFGITQYQIDNWLKKYVDVEKQDSQILANSTKTCKDEQKPIDKVEPKFKVGDWIIRIANGFKHNTYLVTEIKDYYVCEDLKGRRVTFTFNDVHKNFKLWTIQDAKDGDVLFYDDGWACIFKNIHGIWYSSYCFITADGEFHTGYEEHSVDAKLNGNANPATKEQRDTFFAKMKEAGYEWNAEKKELKRVEQKPAWSEEDEEMVNKVIKRLHNHSEGGEEYYNTYYWLKSLKDRYTWKPTEEQIEALESATENCAYSEYQDCLRGLISQLKKRMEE